MKLTFEFSASVCLISWSKVRHWGRNRLDPIRLLYKLNFLPAAGCSSSGLQNIPAAYQGVFGCLDSSDHASATVSIAGSRF